jgi:cytochrome c553
VEEKGDSVSIIRESGLYYIWANGCRAHKRALKQTLLKTEVIMRKLAFLILSSLFIAIPAYSSETGSPVVFRSYMHEIYKSYKNALLSAQTLNYEMTDIHLKHLQDYIRAVSRYVPDTVENGAKLDKAAFLQRLEGFNKKISNLKKTVKKVDVAAIEQLRSDVFSVCADCHKTSKLPYLFRFPEYKTVFEEYMHGIRDNFKMARNYLEKGEALKAEESLKIVNHYLSLLKDVYPEKGPSGVVMDRSWLDKEIKTAQGFNELVQMDLHEKHTGDFVLLKKQLNDICVACHEPERIK